MNTQRVAAILAEKSDASQRQHRIHPQRSFRAPQMRKRGDVLSAKARIIIAIPWQSRFKFMAAISEMLLDTSLSTEERQGLLNNLRTIEEAQP
jgi:hypothetical protein